MGKTYFIVPSYDTPASGPITLGSIIASPRFPEVYLNGNTSSSIQKLPINETSVVDWSHMISNSQQTKVGIWAKFLQSFGVGGDMSVEWDKSETASYRFDKLITRTILPDADHIRTAFEDPKVQEYIKNSRFRGNVYMIVGLKIACGAEIAISKMRAKGINLNLGVDMMPFNGVPLQVGPELGLTNKKAAETSFRQPTDFVFAYRLREIVYKKKAVVSQKDYLKGDLMGVGQGKLSEDEDADDSQGELELLGLKKSDVAAEEWEFEGDQAMEDDGEVCECVSMNAESDDD